MEEVLLRFPHIGEKTFKKLSNKNLAKCKTVSKTWNKFITNEKFYKQRVNYENLQKDVDRDGKTQLHKKARDGQLSECKLIIDHVENKNPTDEFGLTPLHEAVILGHLDVCKLIIKRVEDKNPAKKSGYTPLHFAAMSGHFNVCKLIVERVEDKNPADKHGTVLQIRINPKNNAPGVSKQPAVVNRHFKLNPKIFSKTDDIRPSN